MSVEIEQDGPVWTVINNRPEARNAVDPETAIALTAAFEAFEEDDAALACVFAGTTESFCAGWDLKFAAGLNSPDAFSQEVRELDFPETGEVPRGPMGPSRMTFTKPVIAAVEGPAVAGGMELALLADCRVMGASAYFGVYCRRWGIPLIDGGTVRLPRLVGQGRALEIAMTGRKVSAEEALRIGLCERVVPDGGARAEAETMAHEIARFPQLAMLADRRSILETQSMDIDTGLRREWQNGLAAVEAQGIAGAARFAGGLGRHGTYEAI